MIALAVLIYVFVGIQVGTWSAAINPNEPHGKFFLRGATWPLFAWREFVAWRERRTLGV